MANLIRFALGQRLMMMLLVVLLAGGGYYAFKNIPIDAFPEVSPTQVKVIVKAPGMTPEEVEARITAPIEVELLGIPHQTMLRSIAKYALTDITVDFKEGTDIYWARQQIAERLNTMWGEFACRCRRRHCADDHAVRRNVHVHRGRRRLKLNGTPQLIGLGDTSCTAHGIRRCRCQFAGRHGQEF